MSLVEFISFKATPGEKHLGIASVRYLGKITLRYKIMPGKERGIFANPASYKITVDGEDKYTPSFMIEMNSDAEEVMNCVKRGSSKAMEQAASQKAAPQQNQQNQSFGTAAQQQAPSTHYYSSNQPQPQKSSSTESYGDCPF
jgi:hypothetical protein